MFFTLAFKTQGGRYLVSLRMEIAGPSEGHVLRLKQELHSITHSTDITKQHIITIFENQ